MVRIDRQLSIMLSVFTRRIKKNYSILMYHDISDVSENHINPYFRVSIPPELFAQQMAFLHENGYRGCSISELIECAKLNSIRSTKSVAITFDDGFESVLTHAIPILERYGFTATVYLPSALISNERGKFSGKPLLTWNEVETLQRRKINFGSHTLSHPELITLPKQEVARQITLSKKQIEDKTGTAVTSFAFPYAYPETNKPFTTYCRQVLVGAGYTDAVTTVIGGVAAKDDRLALRRLPVNSGDDIHLLRAKLCGGYNFLHTAQRIVKIFKGRRGDFACNSDFR